MVWGGISIQIKTSLVIVNGNLNNQSYIDQILTPHMVPLLTWSTYSVDCVGKYFIFQQDNVCPHMVRLTIWIICMQR